MNGGSIQVLTSLICNIEAFGHIGKAIMRQLMEARFRGGSMKDRVKE